MDTYLQNIDLVKLDLEGLPHLNERFQLLLAALEERHPGKIIDEAKCLLESVFRTIDTDYHGTDQKDRIDKLRMPELFEEVRRIVTLSEDEDVCSELQEMCKTDFSKVAKIRNANGSSSHGRDGYHESSVGLAEALYIAHTALSIGVLFHSRHRMRSDGFHAKRLKYEDHQEFNDYIDDEAGDSIVIAGNTLIPSEALFNTDLGAYRDALINYLGRQK